MPCAMYILWLGPKMCSFFQTMSSPTLPPSTAPWAVQSERRQTTRLNLCAADSLGNRPHDARSVSSDLFAHVLIHVQPFCSRKDLGVSLLVRCSLFVYKRHLYLLPFERIAFRHLKTRLSRTIFPFDIIIKPSVRTNEHIHLGCLENG